MMRDYVVATVCAEGGMGVVYETEDLRLDRHSALKFLPPDLRSRWQPAKRSSAKLSPLPRQAIGACECGQASQTSSDRDVRRMPRISRGE